MFYNMILNFLRTQSGLFFSLMLLLVLMWPVPCHADNCSADHWCSMSSGTTYVLYDVWGSNNDVYAVGNSGTILHYDGSSWSAMSSGTTNILYGVWGSSNNDVYAVGGVGTILRRHQHTSVYVDIKPGGCPTPINVGSKGVLPVAVLGTADFDVTTIDPTSITLEGVSPLRWAIEDVATPHTINVDECNIMDCNELPGDGYVDLTLKFDTQEIYEAIAEVYDRECLILELTGKLKAAYGDLPIKGGDVVSILKKGKKHNVAPVNSLLLQ